MKAKISGKKRKIMALTVALMLGTSMCTVVQAEDTENYNKNVDGEAIGLQLDDGQSKTITKLVDVNVTGKSVANGKENNNVTGIYVIKNSKLTINKDVKIRVTNSAPATKGLTEGLEEAHSRMSGIYVGDSLNENYSLVDIKGKSDIDVVGTAVQANRGAYVYLNETNIKTKDLTSSDTYALLAKEGSIFVNTKFDYNGNFEGAKTNKVNIYGNIGLLNKNYGSVKNPGKLETYVAIGLSTSDSKLVGGILNEFEESHTNPYDYENGVEMALENGATWENRWLGSLRKEAPRSNAKKYLYTGSKVHYLHGGKTEDKAGYIFQNDGDRPLNIEHYEGHTIIRFNHDGKGIIKGGDIHIEEVLKNKSTIKLRTLKLEGLNINSIDKRDKDLVDKTLSALAQKLVYDADDGKLIGKVEIAEGLSTPAVTKNITYFDDNNRGVYDITGKVPKKTKKFIKHTNEQATGSFVGNDEDRIFDNVMVDVAGSGNGEKHNNVVGLYILDGGQVTVNGNLKTTVKNAQPASRGATPGADVAHYYMSGVYAGYGGKTGDGDHRASKLLVKGDVDMDVKGIALQANHDGYITVEGGGKIKTYEIPTSDTYALLAEEGSVFMNAGSDGKNAGTKDVDIYGNLGVLNKNYGIDVNKGEHGTFVAVGLTTKKSKLVGGVLNEFEESKANKHDSGVDIYLANGATWENKWLGTQRVKAPRRDAEKYLYTGSKVRNLTGGISADKAGIIYQNEDKDITINNLTGHIKVIYEQNKSDAKKVDGGAIHIKSAKDKSSVVLRAKVKDFKMPVAREPVNYDDILNALAGKLFYEAKDNHLTGKAEIAESLTAKALSKDISFKTTGGQGEIKKSSTPLKPNPPTDETKTYTTKSSIDGKNKLYHSSDPLKKAGILKDTGTYEFTTDAKVNAKEIDVTDEKHDVNIKAEGKTLTFNVTEPIGIRSYKKRGYHADGKYPAFNDITVTAKKIILNVSQKDTTKEPKDTFGIAAGSGSGKGVTIKGDLEANVDNKFYKNPDPDGDREPTFTNGIGVVNKGKVLVEGNVNLNVFVPTQEKVHTDHDGDADHSHFLNHYFINGLFAGLNYDKGAGGEIKITGDANIKTNGTGMHAGARSTITILGGGTVKIDKHDDFAQFAMNAEEGVINMNVKLDNTGKVIGANTGTVKMEGNIGIISREETGTIYKKLRSAVNLALVNKDSYFTGIVHDDFREVDRNLALKPGELTDEVKKIREDTGATLYLQNGAIWNNESWGAILPDTWRNISHKFTGSKVKHLIGGNTLENAGIINQNHGRELTIDSFEGSVKAVYKQNAAEEKAFDGGTIRIKNAKENSNITLRANVRNFKADNIKDNKTHDEILNYLAGKLFYEAKDHHLQGIAEISETLSAKAYAKKISYQESGQGEIKKGEKLIGVEENKADDEVAVVKGVKNAVLSSALLWFNHSNDLLRRMGDLRMTKEETGIWTKYQGGQLDVDTKDNNNKDVNLTQKYNMIEVGYDKKMDDWTIGTAFSYGKSKDDYNVVSDKTKVNQKGDVKSYALSGYGSYLGEDGSYIDLIAKLGRVKNKYDVRTKDYATDKQNGDRLQGDYSLNASSLSAEYGKRINYSGGFYLEPSVELTLSHLAGFTVNKVSEQGTKIKISQDAVNSQVARLGIGIGQTTSQGNFYAKIALAHEFGATYLTHFAEEGQTPTEVKLDLKDTWVDAQLGATFRLNKDSYFYGNFTKNFGATLNQKWRLDAGVHFAL